MWGSSGPGMEPASPKCYRFFTTDHQGRSRMFILMPRCVIMGPAEPIIFTLKTTGLRRRHKRTFSITKMFSSDHSGQLPGCNTSIFICQNSWKCTLKMVYILSFVSYAIFVKSIYQEQCENYVFWRRVQRSSVTCPRSHSY